MRLHLNIAFLSAIDIRKRMKRSELPRLDWDDMQCFLAISRLGTLSAAALDMGVTQPTMGRRLERLHERVGAPLLLRTPTGFVLTPAGELVLSHVQRMDEEALAVGRALTGGDNRLHGEVRIATVEAFGAHILIPGLPSLVNCYPGISIEVDVDTRSLSLARREADIAIRMGPFKQHEIVVRKAGTMAFGVYASEPYLVSHQDYTKDKLSGHRLITLQNTLIDMPEGEWFNGVASGASRVLATNSREGQVQACLAGVGLACLPRYLGDTHPDLKLINMGRPPPSRSIWVGTHQDTRNSARIRAVLDWIEVVMRGAKERLNPLSDATMD
jgi:DNA-binding transcriptional LysR family regulator